MKIIKRVGYLIVLTLISVGPFIVDMISWKCGWDRDIPVGIPGGWLGYLLYVAVVIFMMSVVSWYHFWFQDMERKEYQRGKEKKNPIEKYIWILTLVIGTVLIFLIRLYLDIA